MSASFKISFWVTFIILTFSLVLVLHFSQGDLWNWITNVWFYAFCVVSGLDISLVFYIGWDYLNPKESRLPIYLGLAASLLVGLAYKGVVLISKNL